MWWLPVLAVAAPCSASGQTGAIEFAIKGRSAPGFTQLTDVRELSTGSVVVLDFVEQRVFLLDSTLMVTRQILRSGDGPGEFRNAVRLLYCARDRTGVVHTAGTRIAVVLPDGTYDRNAEARLPQLSWTQSRDFESDTSGYYYALVSNVLNRGNTFANTSGAILRSRGDPGAPQPVATFATVPGTPYRRVNPGRITGLFTGEYDAPFVTGIQWRVSRNGMVFVAHPDPYRVEVFDSTGRRVGEYRGTSQRDAVSPAHRAEWLSDMELEHHRAIGRAIGTSRDGTRLDVRSLRIPPPPEPTLWPRVLPAFLPGALFVDGRGRLWIKRVSLKAEGQRFEIYDPASGLIASAVLPRDRRLIGLGHDVAYVAGRDAMDLEFIERLSFRVVPVRGEPNADDATDLGRSG